MSEEVSMYLDDAKETMEKAMVHLKSELAKVRAGKATPAILDGIVVEYYGAPTPLSQVANVNTPDARTIVIQPWEKGIIPAIEKSIINANLGLAPQNDGPRHQYIIAGVGISSGSTYRCTSYVHPFVLPRKQKLPRHY